MKTKFKAYYPLTPDQKRALFNDSSTYFIFDTNALLDIYRLGQPVSKKVIKLFEKYENQIKIPYHVAEEYHEHIYDIMIECDSMYQNLSQKITEEEIIGLIKEKFKDQLFYDHLINILKKQIKNALVEFRKRISKEKKFISEQLETWELPNQLADFLGDKILEKLSNEEIVEIEKDGETRFEKKMPPGHKDDTKKENKYGDLIIWKEILKFASGHPNNPIVFVSRDLNKGDWQWIWHGRKCGLHPCLLKEFINVSNANIVMYPLQDFINYANETGKVFSTEEIDSIRKMHLPDINTDSEYHIRLKNLPSAATIIEKKIVDNPSNIEFDDIKKKLDNINELDEKE